MRSESTNENTGAHTARLTTSSTYENLNGFIQNKNYILTTEIDKDNNISNIINLYDKDRYESNIDANNRVTTERIYSTKHKKYAISTTKIIDNNRFILQQTTSMNRDENGDSYRNGREYSYDIAGNLLEIKKNDVLTNLYSYDPHGRLLSEKNYEIDKEYLYQYDEEGNLSEKIIYNINPIGERIASSKQSTVFIYDNQEWPEQLTKFSDEIISYDKAGNPIQFVDGKKLTWNRGRLLEKIEDRTFLGVVYKYNENGCRIYKSTANAANTKGINTVYEWDNNKLIRETNTDLESNKVYDVWYLYDDKDNMIGYDYNYIDTDNKMKSRRAYFERDIYGSVVGLINEDGNWIAEYSYDAWGNLIKSSENNIYSALINVNHIGYKGYYIDDESGFYYLGNQYYVPELCRMLNADEPLNILETEKNKRNTEFRHNNDMYDNAKPTFIPTDDAGYSISYDVNNQVGVCDTSSFIFESLNAYNTNCYGFAINCWRYRSSEVGIEPGMCTGEGDYNKYVPCISVANRVKSDLACWGKEVKILTGADNNPYYETDDEHYLIAVRVMNEKDYINMESLSDSYHFMIRKNGNWYFKAGWIGEILKLKGNYTPATVNWSQYEYNENINNYNIAYGFEKFYNSEIYYIVIPKMPLRIIG